MLSMNRKIGALCLIGACLLSSTRAAALECEGVTFAEVITIDGRQLVLNGMGVREATVFNVNVYVAGLYVEARSRSAGSLLTDSPKQLTLHFVRDVKRADISDAFAAGLRQSAGADFAALRARLDKLNGWMADVRSGESMTFTYVPDAGLRVRVGNRDRGAIEGADFARAFFGIWLGSHPPNAGLKSGLLGGSCE